MAKYVTTTNINSHLVKCLEEGRVMRFPKIRFSKRINRVRTRRYCVFYGFDKMMIPNCSFFAGIGN